MTSKPSLSLMTGLLIAVVMCSVADAQNRPAKSNFKSIHLSELRRNRVIGSLERPLGEVITIEGIVADENYTRRKADAGELLLRVQDVNGQPLKRAVIVPSHPFQDADITNRSAGTKFKYIGYEPGCFSGIPEKAFDYVPR